MERPISFALHRECLQQFDTLLALVPDASGVAATLHMPFCISKHVVHSFEAATHHVGISPRHMDIMSASEQHQSYVFLAPLYSVCGPYPCSALRPFACCPVQACCAVMSAWLPKFAGTRETNGGLAAEPDISCRSNCAALVLTQALLASSSRVIRILGCRDSAFLITSAHAGLTKAGMDCILPCMIFRKVAVTFPGLLESCKHTNTVSTGRVFCFMAAQ